MSRRIISLSDSSNRNVNLAIDNEWLGQNGTWEALNPGMLNFSSGRFRSFTWGISLNAENARGNQVTVAMLNGFWKVAGIYCNDDGSATIIEGNLLNNDDQASWDQQ